MSAIAGAMSERVGRIKVSQDLVVSMIYEQALNAEREETRLKATELLGKHLALFTENSNVSVNLPQEIVRKSVKSKMEERDAD